MAKKVKAVVRIQLQGGAATPAPPAGSVLGPHGVNIMDFCKQFNARTADKKGKTVPAVITIYEDRSFEFVLKTEPTTDLIKKYLKRDKGSSHPKDEIVGKITWDDVTEIAQEKMPDLNAIDLESAQKVIAGSARSMGVQVVEKEA